MVTQSHPSFFLFVFFVNKVFTVLKRCTLIFLLSSIYFSILYFSMVFVLAIFLLSLISFLTFSSPLLFLKTYLRVAKLSCQVGFLKQPPPSLPSSSIKLYIKHPFYAQFSHQSLALENDIDRTTSRLWLSSRVQNEKWGRKSNQLLLPSPSVRDLYFDLKEGRGKLK